MGVDVLVNLATAHEAPQTNLGDRIEHPLGVYEYVRFESNVSANAVVAINPNNVAAAATNTSTGRIGVCPYAVTASAASPRYGWVLRRGRATALASAGAAGGVCFLTTTAGTLGTTGTTLGNVRFVTDASGGSATVIFPEPVAL